MVGSVRTDSCSHLPSNLRVPKDVLLVLAKDSAKSVREMLQTMQHGRKCKDRLLQPSSKQPQESQKMSFSYWQRTQQSQPQSPKGCPSHIGKGLSKVSLRVPKDVLRVPKDVLLILAKDSAKSVREMLQTMQVGVERVKEAKCRP